MGESSSGSRAGSLPRPSPHTGAVLEALLVTLLWSSSYVFIKVGLRGIPPLTFAGLRYAIAAGVLLVPFLRRGQHRTIARLSRRDLALLLALGVLLYAVTQGAQFVALQYVRAATVSLVLSFTPAMVALVGIPLLGERPTVRQWFWLAVLLVGVGSYFYPFGIGSTAALGVAVVGVGLLANAFAAVLGRYANRGDSPPALAVTTVSMGFGSALLLATGVLAQGLPPLSPSEWAIVLWLALANTAFAFTLWNRTLQTLSATESSVINNTMLVQVAVVGWAFLEESLDVTDLLGIALVSVGVVFVQVTGRR